MGSMSWYFSPSLFRDVVLALLTSQSPIVSCNNFLNGVYVMVSAPQGPAVRCIKTWGRGRGGALNQYLVHATQSPSEIFVHVLV